MRWLSMFSIKIRLIFNNAVLLVAILGLTASTLLALSVVHKEVDLLSGIESERQKLIVEWNSVAHINVTRLQTLAFTEDLSLGDFLIPEFKKSQKRIDEIAQEIEKLETEDSAKTLISNAIASKIKFDELAEKIISNDGSVDKLEKIQLAGGVLKNIAQQYIDNIQRFDNFQAHRVVTIKEKTISAIANTTIIVVSASFFALVIGTLFSAANIISIARPLKGAVLAAQSIASGNLSTPLNIQGRDEVQDLMYAMMKMQESLRDVVLEVGNAAQSVTTTAQEMVATSEDLSERTEQQAANLQETAASMEQISSTIDLNSQVVKNAEQISREASNAAIKSGEAVGQVMQTMQKIRVSSIKISEIVGVIDSIAFQTNILALNAAVEAARAGDLGRGFAVVAGEVRTLAQRCASASKEIRVLVHESSETVEAGSQEVTNAEQRMRKLVDTVQEVSTMLKQVLESVLEENAEISQVNEAMMQLDGMTQRNVAVVEQSTASAARLKAEANKLHNAVIVFQL